MHCAASAAKVLTFRTKPANVVVRLRERGCRPPIGPHRSCGAVPDRPAVRSRVQTPAASRVFPWIFYSWLTESRSASLALVAFSGEDFKGSTISKAQPRAQAVSPHPWSLSYTTPRTLLLLPAPRKPASPLVRGPVSTYPSWSKYE